MNEVPVNDLFEIATGFVNHTSQHLFITGKAGTGKTTFLKQLQSSTIKNAVVVAPTGVAAINAGGVTIHSFFQLPFAPYLPVPHSASDEDATSKSLLLQKLRLSRERRTVMQALDLLIIDEISMVRCDVLDAIDAVLRHVRNKPFQPFGGLQVVYIGDLYQLPPVVQPAEWSILSGQYASPYFFSSKVIAEQPPLILEFKKVFRQTDLDFLNVLNDLRHNTLSPENYRLLKSRMLTDPQEAEGVIILTTHNKKADGINAEKLLVLPGRERTFEAEKGGEFYEGNFPTDEFLKLKPGAQVMFVKNDSGGLRQYYNGKLGKVKDFEDEHILIESEGVEIKVGREVWRSVRYSVNEKTGGVEEEEAGTFTQYPLRLAWAITIHKSQGLTFDRVAIDSINSFSPGQVYVALSRCRSLEGIYLLTEVQSSQMHTPPVIAGYMSMQAAENNLHIMLQNGMRQFQQGALVGLFDFTEINKSLAKAVYNLRQIEDTDRLNEWINSLQALQNKANLTAEKFKMHFPNYFDQEEFPFDNPALASRLKDAATWFNNLFDDFVKQLKGLPVVTDNVQKAKDAEDRIEKLYQLVQLRQDELKVMKDGLTVENIYKAKRTFKPRPSGVSLSGAQHRNLPADLAHPDLYLALNDWRNEVCSRDGLPVYMVCSTATIREITNRMPSTIMQLKQVKGFGNIKCRLYGKAILQLVNDYVSLNNVIPEGEAFSSVEPTVKPKKEKINTKGLTLQLLREGSDVAAIAIERNLTEATIAGHLAHYLGTGELQIEDLLTAEKLHSIKNLLNNLPGEINFTRVRNNLPKDLKVYEVMWVTSLKRKD